MAKSKDEKVMKGALSEESATLALQRIDEMMAQLSDRHAAALRKIAELEKALDEKLEQVSAEAEAALEKLAELAELGKDVDGKLEQLSDRHAATQRLLARLEKETHEKLEHGTPPIR